MNTAHMYLSVTIFFDFWVTRCFDLFGSMVKICNYGLSIKQLTQYHLLKWTKRGVGRSLWQSFSIDHLCFRTKASRDPKGGLGFGCSVWLHLKVNRVPSLQTKTHPFGRDKERGFHVLLMCRRPFAACLWLIYGSASAFELRLRVPAGLSSDPLLKVELVGQLRKPNH